MDHSILETLNSRTGQISGYIYKLMGNHGPDQFGMDVVIPDNLDVDEGEMSVVIPFADGRRRDGVGDLLEVGGINTERHIKNPIVLFDHGKKVDLPIGLTEDPQTKEYLVSIDPVLKQARAKAFFYQGNGNLTGISPRGGPTKEYDHALFCEQLFDLVSKRFIRAGSIGYQVINAKHLMPDYEFGTPQGLHLLSVRMLEVSVVVMPANQDTVSKCLSMPKICGKPLSPYLVKSLAPYAPAKNAQMGYEGQKAQGMYVMPNNRRVYIQDADQIKIDRETNRRLAEVHPEYIETAEITNAEEQREAREARGEKAVGWFPDPTRPGRQHLVYDQDERKERNEASLVRYENVPPTDEDEQAEYDAIPKPGQMIKDDEKAFPEREENQYKVERQVVRNNARKLAQNQATQPKGPATPQASAQAPKPQQKAVRIVYRDGTDNTGRSQRFVSYDTAEDPNKLYGTEAGDIDTHIDPSYIVGDRERVSEGIYPPGSAVRDERTKAINSKPLLPSESDEKVEYKISNESKERQQNTAKQNQTRLSNMRKEREAKGEKKLDAVVEPPLKDASYTGRIPPPEWKPGVGAVKAQSPGPVRGHTEQEQDNEIADQQVAEVRKFNTQEALPPEESTRRFRELETAHRFPGIRPDLRTPGTKAVVNPSAPPSPVGPRVSAGDTSSVSEIQAVHNIAANQKTPPTGEPQQKARQLTFHPEDTDYSTTEQLINNDKLGAMPDGGYPYQQAQRKIDNKNPIRRPARNTQLQLIPQALDIPESEDKQLAIGQKAVYRPDGRRGPVITDSDQQKVQDEQWRSGFNQTPPLTDQERQIQQTLPKPGPMSEQKQLATQATGQLGFKLDKVKQKSLRAKYTPQAKASPGPAYDPDSYNSRPQRLQELSGGLESVDLGSVTPEEIAAHGLVEHPDIPGHWVPTDPYYTSKATGGPGYDASQGNVYNDPDYIDPDQTTAEALEAAYPTTSGLPVSQDPDRWTVSDFEVYDLPDTDEKAADNEQVAPTIKQDLPYVEMQKPLRAARDENYYARELQRNIQKLEEANRIREEIRNYPKPAINGPRVEASDDDWLGAYSHLDYPEYEIPEQEKAIPLVGTKPSDKISKGKARQMLKDGTAHGHALTDKQRRMLGAAASKNLKALTPDEKIRYYAEASDIDPSKTEYGVDFTDKTGQETWRAVNEGRMNNRDRMRYHEANYENYLKKPPEEKGLDFDTPIDEAGSMKAFDEHRARVRAGESYYTPDETGVSPRQQDFHDKTTQEAIAAVVPHAYPPSQENQEANSRTTQQLQDHTNKFRNIYVDENVKKEREVYNQKQREQRAAKKQGGSSAKAYEPRPRVGEQITYLENEADAGTDRAIRGRLVSERGREYVQESTPGGEIFHQPDTNSATVPRANIHKGKSVKDLRAKYAAPKELAPNKVKIIRHKTLGAKQGNSMVYMDEKDLPKAREHAKQCGLVMELAGQLSDGRAKVRVLGFDDAIDSLAQRFGTAPAKPGKKNCKSLPKTKQVVKSKETISVPGTKFPNYQQILGSTQDTQNQQQNEANDRYPARSGYGPGGGYLLEIPPEPKQESKAAPRKGDRISGSYNQGYDSGHTIGRREPNNPNFDSRQIQGEVTNIRYDTNTGNEYYIGDINGDYLRENEIDEIEPGTEEKAFDEEAAWAEANRRYYTPDETGSSPAAEDYFDPNVENLLRAMPKYGSPGHEEAVRNHYGPLRDRQHAHYVNKEVEKARSQAEGQSDNKGVPNPINPGPRADHDRRRSHHGLKELTNMISANQKAIEALQAQVKELTGNTKSEGMNEKAKPYYDKLGQIYEQMHNDVMNGRATVEDESGNSVSPNIGKYREVEKEYDYHQGINRNKL